MQGLAPEAVDDGQQPIIHNLIDDEVREAVPHACHVAVCHWIETRQRVWKCLQQQDCDQLPLVSANGVAVCVRVCVRAGVRVGLYKQFSSQTGMIPADDVGDDLCVCDCYSFFRLHARMIRYAYRRKHLEQHA